VYAERRPPGTRTSVISSPGRSTFSPLHTPIPRTNAVSGLEACTRRIFECQYGNVRTFDACAVSIPACKTDPWWTDEVVCCPQQCIDGYVAARSAGKDQLSAMRAVYRDDGTCGGAF